MDVGQENWYALKLMTIATTINQPQMADDIDQGKSAIGAVRRNVVGGCVDRLGISHVIPNSRCAFPKTG